MPIGTYNHPLFGLIKFEVARWARGEPIRRFISGFDPSDVTYVRIPQLVNKPGTNEGLMKFHKRAHAQVLQVFSDLEELGLLHYVHTSAGSFNMRLKKPASGNVSREPSEHSFGIAIDINSEELTLGTDDTGRVPGTVRPLAPTFEKLGFRWGQSFSDPMHFEVATFVDHPKSTVKRAHLVRAGMILDVRVKVINGHAMASTADFARALGGSSVFVQGPGTNDEVDQTPPNGVTVRLKCLTIDNHAFALVALLAGVYGYSIDWDNTRKTATLVAPPE